MRIDEIIVIIIVSIYLLFISFYYLLRIKNGRGISSTCDECKDKGKRLIKYYYLQKKKELKRGVDSSLDNNL